MFLAGVLAAGVLLEGCGGGARPAADVSSTKTGDTLYVARSSAWVPGAADSARAPRLAPAASLVPGYRVQIYQTLSLVEAESHARVAAEVLGVPGYVEFRAPYYRVRMGDCRTRAAGEGLLGRVARSGYPGAGLVEALVQGDVGAPPEGKGR